MSLVTEKIQKKRSHFVFLIFLVFLSNFAFAAEVDTISTFSASMKKNIKAVVITPDTYDKQKKFPVVYLLHGYSGTYKSWIAAEPALKNYADRYQVIIVCPDGDKASWYFDSPVNPKMHYETYIAKELVGWIDKHYSTLQDKTGRAITGLSMGGHGALYLAFKHQDVFGTAGSLSGGVDLRPFPDKWGISELLGSYANNPTMWDKNSGINMTHLLTPKSLSIIIACGVDDFFYAVNVDLHNKLLSNNIPHTFISAPGGHTWDFWRMALKYQMEFFNTEFSSK